MPSLRVLTVDLADLNLETDVINGAKVEISIERTTTFDSFVIAPSLDYKATSDETGILTFNILPSDANTVYRASVIDASGKQVLSSVFVMTDSNANLAELLELSYFPDGLNVGQNTEASFIQFKSNGTNLGTPQTVRNFNMAQDGLLTFDLDTFTVTLDLASINTAIAGKEPSIAAGTTLKYWRGDKTWQTLDTSVVPSTTDRRYVTDAQLAVIGNTSGTNTGDETATTIRDKVGNASSTNTGVLSSTDWATFNDKQNALGFTPENVTNKDTDGALTANSDTKYPSQKAVKTYSDSPKSSVWRLVDSTDTSKKLALNLSAVGTATTKTLTMPNADVNLGYVPSSFAVSGGVVTMTGAGGNTLSFAVSDPAAIVTSSDINLVAGRVYQCSDDTSSYTINLPATPADGDWVVIKDTTLNKDPLS